MTPIILPDIEDIKHFLTAGSDKGSNDESNKIREHIIACLPYLTEEYFSHPEYGTHWSNISTKFKHVLDSLCGEPYSSVSIKQMGGMTYNYDFLVSFYSGIERKSIIKQVKLEFKHNNTNVSDLVQFLELYDKDCKSKFDICGVSYAEFYYDNYLGAYLACDRALENCPLPDRDTYLKNVYDIKYKHLFFKLLHENKMYNVAEKKRIANESVTRYIQQYLHTFQFEKIVQKIKESQTSKVFLLWDCENFHIQTLDVDDLNITNIKKVDKLYFDLETSNFQYNIRVRLNWGNSNGLSNPRWKFSFISK